MSNLQIHYRFKIEFQKMDRHTGVKWLYHGTTRRMDNQLQSLELLLWVTRVLDQFYAYYCPDSVLQNR